MRGFVRDEVIPLETLDLDEATFRRVTDPLKQEVKERNRALDILLEQDGQRVIFRSMNYPEG